MRASLWIHNHTREPKHKKGMRNWLKYKVGKPPVLFEERIIANNLSFLDNNLYYRGYFGVESGFELKEEEKTVSLNFIIETGKPFLIDTVVFPGNRSPLETAITKTKPSSLLTPGSPYDLQQLKNERKRIERSLKDEGYYYFNHDYILYRIDSTLGNHKMRVFLGIKPQIPGKSLAVYKLRKVSIIDDFNKRDSIRNSFRVGHYDYFSKSNYVRPDIVTKMLSLYPDKRYSRTRHLNNISRLESMGAFRFVTIKYDPVSDSTRQLDATVLLSPAKKLSLNTEVNAVAKTNNFVGPGVKLTFKSRNFFKGGELFTVNLHGRFETQVAGNDKGNTAYEVGTDMNLIIPRIIPFNIKSYRGSHVFYTKSTVGYNIFQRLNLYQFNTSHGSWSYNWKRSNPVFHQLKLLDISFTNLVKTTDEFNDWLNNNPSLKRSFEEQFILSTAYSYTLNHLEEEYKRKYFFRFAVDPAGNLMTAILSLGKKEKPTSDKPYKLFGNPISQFFRALTEARYYIKMGKQSIIATRLFIGAGVPYGNSSTIPYVRQFFVGGTNSLRGFAARSVGPGSYTPPDSLQGLNIDQTGDIKTEANIEYRFPMTKHLEGALFADFGNVWLVHMDSTRVGGVFDFKRFYKEVAISSGIGLRIDFNVVIVRFDLGFPLRKPWLPEGERWVIGAFNPFNRDWRKDNLILNFSVGYPF